MFSALYSGRTEIVRTRPSRLTSSVAGVAAMHPSTCLPAHSCEATSLPKWIESVLQAQPGEAVTVDGEDPVAGLERLLGRGVRPNRAHRLVRFLRREEVDAEEDQEGEDDVHGGAGADHDDPLPDRLAVVGTVGDLRRNLLLRIHAGDFHVAAERDRFDPVLGLAALERPDRRAEEEEEALDPHPGRLGGDVVAGLVEHDQQAEADEDVDPVHACASPFDLLLGAPARLGVDREEVLEMGQRRGRHLLQNTLDRRSDRLEADPPVEEGGDGDLVGGVQHAGRRPPASPASRARRRQAKVSRSGASKVSSPTVARSRRGTSTSARSGWCSA